MDKNKLSGNYFDKYGSKNPIVRYLMQKFSNALIDLVTKARPDSIHDVGCGEGTWSLILAQKGYHVKGSDLSSTIFFDAQEKAKNLQLSHVFFQKKNILQMNPSEDSADLILCSEVLEHIDEPERAMEILQNIVQEYLILSVPREPIWRILNIFRGSYWRSLGNTPGHVQHWSKNSFINFVSKYFEVIEVKQPLPWTMLLCKKRERV